MFAAACSINKILLNSDTSHFKKAYVCTHSRLKELDVISSDDLLVRIRYDGTVDWEPPMLFVTHCEVGGLPFSLLLS